MTKRFWIIAPFLSFTLLIGLIGSNTRQAWAANCEPTDGENRPSIEELVGPLDKNPQEKTPDEVKAEQEQTDAQRREKQVRELRQAEIDRLTAKLQTSLDDPNLWLTRARIRAEIDQREGAISDLTQFMKRKGKSAEQLAQRGKLYYSLNQFDEAEADLNEAVQLEPDNTEMLYARGKLYIDQWKTQEAYRDFSKVIAIEPRHKMARFNRGYLLMGVKGSYGNYRQALEDLKIVVDIDPDWVLARYHYVRVLHSLGKSEEVIRHATFVLWHEPDSECMYSYRSAAYRFLDKFDLALSDATKYMEFNPRAESRIGMRAAIYTRMGEHEKAIDDWKTYLKIKPNSVDGYDNLIESYKALKRYDDALAVYDKVMELEPNNSDWPRFRGMLKGDVGDFQGALADLTTSIEMGGNNYDNRANIYDDMGEYAKAWADRVYQTYAVKAFVGKTIEYEQELADEEKVLAALVEQQINLLQTGKRLTRSKSLWPHNKHSAWGGYWLRGLTSLVTSDNAETQKLGVQGFRDFVDNLRACPLPPEETQTAVDALNKLAAGDQPEPIKKEASILAKDLAVLQVANDPQTEAWQPGSLYFKTFTIEKDEQGRSTEFRQFDMGWLERKKGSGENRFREIRRTPQFIEMYALDRALWVRLEVDQAKWSFDRENWKLIGKGEITQR
ncbi:MULTISPECIES: tetratricopeptide repeat protein [Pirellulaceae]|nr:MULTISPECIES: tetratricopeptide repeat protein [Pirellulaceae]